MAKTFDMEHFEDAIVSEVYVLVNGVKCPLIVEYEKESTTPATATKLNQIIDEIDTLCREGTTSKDIVIGNETEVTEDTKIFIDTSEVENLGSEVVDSLIGNEVNKSPSVRAVNEAISIFECGQTENTLVQANGYTDINISFTKSFSKAPMVVVCLEMSSTNVEYTNVKCIVVSRTKLGAVIRLFNSSSASKQPRINWIAVGE